MSNEKLELPYGRGKLRRQRFIKFANAIIDIQNKIGFKMSVRGWCYQLEGFGLLIKSDFDKVQNIINKCRKYGLLPVDMVVEDASRAFRGVEKPDTETPKDFTSGYLNATIEAENYYTPDWWWQEKYYIQMLVEKVDLKTLFTPVCTRYHIPIATSKDGQVLHNVQLMPEDLKKLKKWVYLVSFSIVAIMTQMV